MQGSDRERGSDATKNEALVVDRRSYLKLAGVAVGSVPLLAGRTSAAFERHGIRFERTIDMVRDAGCDPTGQEPCDEQITEAADDFTLLKFPVGEYKITRQNVIFDKTNLGFLGVGDVRFTVPERYDDKMFVVERGTGLLFEGIDIDQRAYGATPGLHLAAEDDLWIQDVEFIGQGEDPDSYPQDCANEQIEGCHGNEGVTDALYPIVRSPDGVGVIRNVVARNGGVMGSYTRIGVWIGVSTEGTVRLENCQFEEFSGNGLYCSRTYGVVEVEGGRFRNNDVSQVRLGSRGSYVANALIEVDATDSGSPNPWDALNQRGVWFESRKYGGNGPEVRDCDIAIVATPNSSGGVVTASTVDDFSVQNTRIAIDADGVRGVSGYASTGEAHSAALRGVSVTGSAANSQAVWLKNHSESVIENCCIHQEGASRAGVWLDNSPETVVRESTIDVTGRQIVEESCQATVIDIADSGSCPMPDLSTGLPHTLSIDGAGSRTEYTFSVSGDLEGASLTREDTISGSTATGAVGGGRDSYAFSGELVSFALDGEANVTLDGEPAHVGQRPDHALIIDGAGSRTEYTFTVSGNLEGASLTREDTISGSTATGAVGGGRDSYAFSGELVSFALDGEANVTLDGEPAHVGQRPDHALVIDGDGSRTDYRFSVSGNLEGASLTREDTISGSTATGAVGGGRDSYAFSGEIESIDIDGDARVFLNGDPLDVGLPHSLSIASNSGRYSYEFTVSGDLEKGDAMGAADPNDIVSGRTATGQGGDGGIDSYAFSGEVTEFSLAGDATVYLDGKAVGIEEFLPNVLTVDGSGSRVGYAFSASGGVASHGSLTQEDDIAVETNSVAGAVGPGRDSYSFGRNIKELSIDSRARIEVDRSARTISVSGTGRYASYRLAVTGRFRRTGSVDNGGDLSDGTASGAVAPGTDTYRYTGEIRELTIDDYVSVTVL